MTNTGKEKLNNSNVETLFRDPGPHRFLPWTCAWKQIQGKAFIIPGILVRANYTEQVGLK